MPTTATRKPRSKPRSKKAKVINELTINTLEPEERQQMIAEAAYYIAEQRGFVPGQHEQDWLEAERQVDETLSRHLTEDAT